jgi:hypothetical protein
VGRYPPGLQSVCSHLSLGFSQDLRRYTLSGKRCFRRQRGANSDFEKLLSAQSFGDAHRGRVCVRVFIGVSVCMCCERLRCTV